MTFPTAVQAARAGHDTAVSSADPATTGVACSAHRVPSQCSTRAAVVPLASLMYQPTAVQADADEQDTPVKAAVMSSTGFGLA